MSRFPWLSAGRARVVLLGFAVAAQVVALQLVLRTPYLYDDSPNQNLKGYLVETHQSLWTFLSNMIHGQWVSLGRFAPLGLYENYGMMNLWHDRVGYKVLLIVMTIGAVLAVARVLVVLSVPAEIALLGAGLTSVLYQLHNYHDALLGYAGLMQLVVLIFCGSLLLFIRWLRGGHWLLLVGSVLLVIAADLAYEASYLLVVLHVAVVVIERKPLRKAAAPVAVSLIFVVLTAYLRTKNLGSGQNYSISLKPGEVLPALFKQLSATLPMANFLDPGGPKGLPASGRHTPLLKGALIGLFLLPLLWAAGERAKTWRPEGRAVGVVAAIALSFLLLPAALVALAVRYQVELRWGVGYLPVFFGVIAVGILAALLYSGAARWIPVPILAIVCALGLGAMAARNAEGNTRIVVLLNPLAASRDELSDALHHGLLDTVADDDMLLFDEPQITPPNGFLLSGYGMEMSQWISTLTPRRVRSTTLSQAAPLAGRCPAGSAPDLVCPALPGPLKWFTTGVTDRTRWAMVIPLADSTLKPKSNLYTAHPQRAARLIVRTRDTRRIAGLQTRWSRPKDGQILTPDSGGRIVRQSGDWSLVDVDVPAGVSASSGVLGKI
jgi:hypothetical protein